MFIDKACITVNFHLETTFVLTYRFLESCVSIFLSLEVLSDFPLNTSLPICFLEPCCLVSTCLFCFFPFFLKKFSVGDF